MKWPGAVGASYVSQSPLAANEEMINWYPERTESPSATVPSVMYPTPGLLAFVTVADSPGRAAFAEDDKAWAVIGEGFYRVYETGIATLIGKVQRDANPATICSNGDNEIFVTSGDHGYVWNLDTSKWTEVLTHGATQGGSLGGYFIVFDKTAQEFRCSGLFDGATWDPLQASGFSLAPDPRRAMVINNGYLYFFGEKTSEIWKNAGGPTFPFVPLMTTVLPFGVASTFAATSVEQSVVWLNHNEAGAGQVMQTEGVNPREIQTHAVARVLESYTKIDDAVAWGYQQEAHTFVNFDFPSAKNTWTYDNKTQLWHRRGFWDSSAAQYTAWRPAAHMHAWGKHLVVDRNSGTIFHMDPSFSLDDEGNGIRRLRRLPTIYDDNKMLVIGPIEIIAEVGLGTATGQGQNPKILMRISYNGGKTFGSWRSRSLGAMGHYDDRVVFERNGAGRKVVIELVVTDPIPARILDVTVDVEREAA